MAAITMQPHGHLWLNKKAHDNVRLPLEGRCEWMETAFSILHSETKEPQRDQEIAAEIDP